MSGFVQGGGPGGGAAPFLRDLDDLCLLIEEASRYGSTAKLQIDYLDLRRRTTLAFRGLSESFSERLMPIAGFHGCGFEMILGPFSLEALIQATPRKTVAKLRDIGEAVRQIAFETAVS